MTQPEWTFLVNLGDVNPIESGGLFVYTDKTGVYPPEMERLEPTGKTFEVHRVLLERCTFIDGVLSENKYHPEHPAWFASELAQVSATMDYDIDELRADLCSDDPKRLATAYRAIYDHCGWENGDCESRLLSRKRVQERYNQNELG